MQGFAGKRGITYTRYADDLSFSGMNPLKVIRIYPMVKEIIESEKLQINFSKTRMAGTARAKRITGLTIANDTFGIGSGKYKQLRAKVHSLTKACEQTNTKLYQEVVGYIAYMNLVDKRRLGLLKIYIKKLSDKHPSTKVVDILKLKLLL